MSLEKLILGEKTMQIRLLILALTIIAIPQYSLAMNNKPSQLHQSDAFEEVIEQFKNMKVTTNGLPIKINNTTHPFFDQFDFKTQTISIKMKSRLNSFNRKG